jgi:uncharacterized membrane protein YhhN
MKKVYWLVLFLLILLADLLSVYFKWTVAEHFFKPLIVVWLMAYFVLDPTVRRSPLRKWIIFALFFSWLGDVFLLLQEDYPIFFLLGLSAFLIAHLFYIYFFHLIRTREAVPSRIALVIVVAVYYFAVVAILSPYLGDLKLPVRVYAIVISFMFLLAMHMLFIRNREAGRIMMAGALLFVISDSILAFNKFYSPISAAGLLIMGTYGLAQLFITEGAIRYISSTEKE